MKTIRAKEQNCSHLICRLNQLTSPFTLDTWEASARSIPADDYLFEERAAH